MRIILGLSDFTVNILGGIVVTIVLLIAVAVAYYVGDPPRAMANVTSDQGTDMERASWCVDHKIVDKVIAGFDILNAMAVTFEATDEYWFGMWLQSQAEIERLKARVARPHISFAPYGGQYVPKCCEGYLPGSCFCL